MVSFIPCLRHLVLLPFFLLSSRKGFASDFAFVVVAVVAVANDPQPKIVILNEAVRGILQTAQSKDLRLLLYLQLH
jgi:hypothetical protein